VTGALSTFSPYEILLIVKRRLLSTSLGIFSAGIVLLTLSACATVQAPSKDDPWESANRAVYAFNEKLDRYALKPVSRGYVTVTPKPVRESVTNFFSNIGDVYNAANNLLQLRITDGVEDIMRIVINTVFGVGGLFDVATEAKLPKHNQDFGLTLGHYGVPSGPYLVLPFFGPSTVRDGVGLVGNYFINPLTYVNPDALSWSLYGLNVVNTRANLLGASDLLDSAAIDEYSLLRNVYLQRRESQISADGASEQLPTYDNEDSNPNLSDTASKAAQPMTARRQSTNRENSLHSSDTSKE
jgi:phospholipid-binding lipoprotein MlaA